LDCNKLYEDTIETWVPANWDLRNWFSKSPFPINGKDVDYLARHYDALRKIRPRENRPSPGLSPDLRRYYDRLSGFSLPERREPIVADVLRDLALSDINPWPDSASSVVPMQNGVEIHTPQGAWSYAAALPFDSAMDRHRGDDVAIRILVASCVGSPKVSFFNSASNLIFEERDIDAKGHALIIQLPREDNFDSILFRNGPNNSASTISIERIEVVALAED
jgi:hypothetical protein